MSPLVRTLSAFLPKQRVITDQLRRFAYGTDASLYRLIPEVVVQVDSEQEVQSLLQAARKHGRPVTFRAAGTSLSGQAITDGILAMIGDGFATCDITAEGQIVRLGPSMVGGQVNARLAPFGRKLAADPASINACKIGGIAANNASGMCCGASENCYTTLAGLRVVLADGTVLDTEDAESVASFRQSHAALLDELKRLGESTRANETLARLIRHKYRIKNTTGYSLNALVDHEDPIDILTHLMIGSEGTLGFISRITFRTLVEEPCKASALVFFPDVQTACQAVIELKPQSVSAVELLDRQALRAVEHKPGLPGIIRTLGEEAAALLMEVRASDPELLQERIDKALDVLRNTSTIEPPEFSTDPETCTMYWNVRKGIFPSTIAVRPTGTTVIIEDVAFAVESLAAATLDLQALLKRHGYHGATLYGHALEGNLHFVFAQDFGNPAEVERYARMLDEVCTLVIDKYDGALKGEHGTGRNMAPFVRKEWGEEATNLMHSIKKLLDPEHLLNPGVVLSDDPQSHLQSLKLIPAADARVDGCTECGFCEVICPSHGLTFSPRQRIVSWRELSRRTAAGERISDLERSFAYQSLDTCAGCSLCSTICPIGIDTGELTRSLRGRRLGSAGRKLGQWSAGHFATLSTLARMGLALGHVASGILGNGLLARLSGGAWKQGMARPGKAPEWRNDGNGTPVVYFPACPGRIFGPSRADDPNLADVVIQLLQRAGYAPRLPEGYQQLCCGQMLASKGMAEEADRMSDDLIEALLNAADDGQGGYYPVIMDASTCSARMQKKLAGRLEVLDFHVFAHDVLLPRLTLRRKPGPVALHINCSVRNAVSEAKLRQLIATCADEVIELSEVTCCGFAGDRGFVVPELNQHALRRVHLPESCTEGVSTNRTCEIGLTAETGRPYRSVAYLLEECSRT